MIVKRTKNSMYNIQKLRNIYYKSNETIDSSLERISLLNRFLRSIYLKHIFLRIITLFIYKYRLETIKLCKQEINEEKKKIENAVINFDHVPSITTHVLDKLNALYNQLKKMRVFYQLDGTFYGYEQIDLNNFEKHNFNYLKKDNKLYIEDEVNSYEFNSLFIGKYDRKGKLLELFSSDNTEVVFKTVNYYSKVKKAGMNIKKQTWLYHNPDGTKDDNFHDNYPIYVYEFDFIKIIFKSKSFIKEYAFLGNDQSKMTLFYDTLLEYINCLNQTYYDITSDKGFDVITTKKLLELFLDNNDYSWIIFDILLKNCDKEIIKLEDIYHYYKISYNDLINIVAILKRYQLVEVSLSMDLIVKYKEKEIKEMYERFLLEHKKDLIKGEANG